MKEAFIWALCAVLALASPARAQEASAERAKLIAEINVQLWQPFIEGVNDNRPGLYNGVHSDDFYWVAAGSKTRIMDARAYAEDSRKVMDGRAAKACVRTSTYAFLSATSTPHSLPIAPWSASPASSLESLRR